MCDNGVDRWRRRDAQRIESERHRRPPGLLVADGDRQLADAGRLAHDDLEKPDVWVDEDDFSDAVTRLSEPHEQIGGSLIDDEEVIDIIGSKSVLHLLVTDRWLLRGRG